MTEHIYVPTDYISLPFFSQRKDNWNQEKDFKVKSSWLCWKSIQSMKTIKILNYGYTSEIHDHWQNNHKKSKPAKGCS